MIGKRDCGILNSDQNVYVIPHPQCSGIHVKYKAESLKEPEVVNDFKETAFSRYIMADAHMNSQTLIHNSRKVNKQNPSIQKLSILP